MYLEATAAIAAVDLRWKPSSYAALGPSGATVVLPPCAGHDGKVIPCVQQLQWLGFAMSYSEFWHEQVESFRRRARRLACEPKSTLWS